MEAFQDTVHLKMYEKMRPSRLFWNGLSSFIAIDINVVSLHNINKVFFRNDEQIIINRYIIYNKLYAHNYYPFIHLKIYTVGRNTSCFFKFSHLWHKLEVIPVYYLAVPKPSFLQERIKV